MSFHMKLGSFVLVSALAGCGDTPDPIAGPDACDKSITATGAEVKHGHPEQPSTCKAVVLTCNACVYDAEGSFLRVESEVCGVCVGTSF